jgi:hypothetical protein
MITNGRLFDFVPMKLLLMMMIFPHLFHYGEKKQRGGSTINIGFVNGCILTFAGCSTTIPLIFHGRCLYQERQAKQGNMSSAV